MKWFVTDAQLAALRLEVYEQARDACQVTLNAQRDNHAAEIERLRDPSVPFVEHLRAEVEFWRMQFRHERQRSEIALDQCRITHQGIGPVSAPPREERLPSQFPATEEQALAGLNLDAM